MFRFTAWKVAVLVGATSWGGTQAAMGQIFTRHVHEAADVMPNASCEMGVCLPSILTYGHYRENWRRWPGELPTSKKDISLSPFAVPDRDTPAVELPDPRDESSQSPRMRGDRWTPADRSAPPEAEAAPSTVTPERTDAAPGLEPAAPSDVPIAPPTDLDAAPEDGFFPAPSQDVPETDLLPDDLDGDELGSDAFGPDDLGPIEEDTGFGAEDLNALPDSGSDDLPSDDGDDIFDLDEFGHRDDARLRRYQARRDPRSLRRAAQGQSGVQRASYESRARRSPAVDQNRSNASRRKNPLRVRPASARRSSDRRQHGVAARSAANRRSPGQRTLHAQRAARRSATVRRDASGQVQRASHLQPVAPHGFRSVNPPQPDWRASERAIVEVAPEYRDEASTTDASRTNPLRK